MWFVDRRAGAHRLGWLRRAVAVAMAVSPLAARSVDAVEPGVEFNIPSEDLGSALLDLAIQAKVSIGSAAARDCVGRGPALVGRMTPRAALDRLLAGSGCGYRFLDTQAIEIVRLKPRQPAPAADAPPELVVVASPRPTPVDRLAYGVSFVDHQSLTEQGVRDTGDLAMLTPAMTVTNLGLGRDKVLLRGLSDGPLTGQTQSMVSLYLDDVRLTYNAPDPDLRLTDIDRVEVLRGPQGSLYGAGSLGGVVRTVAAQPDPARFAATAAATDSLAARGQGSHAFDAMLNAPIVDGRGAARLVLYDEVDGGYINDPGLGLGDVNRSTRQGGRLSVKLDLNGRWSVSAGAVSQGINNDDTQYSLANLTPYTRQNRLREPHDNDFSDVNLGLNGDLGWGELRSSIAVIRHGLTSRYDASAAPPVPIATLPAAFDDQRRIETLITETTLVSRPNSRIQWLAGFFFAHTNQTTQATLTALGGTPFVALNETRDDQIDEAAGYGEATAQLGGDFAITLGGRLSSFWTRVWSVNAASGFPSGGFVGDNKQANFAPKAVIAYHAPSGLLIYAQAAEGYRGGGFNTLGPPGQAFGGAGGLEPLRRYEGDELWSLEAGAKLGAEDGRWRLRLAGFETFWKNLQSDQLLPSGLPFTANIGAGRNSGLEAEGILRAGALELRGQLLANGPELTRANPALPAFADFSLSAVPDVSAGLSASYGWTLADDRGLTLDGRMNYIGRSQLILDAVRPSSMGDYMTGRLAANYAAAHWRWTLAIDNPTDARANTFSFGNPFTVRSTRQQTPLRPRTTSLTLSVNF